jgi:hypothetical protein
MGHEDIRTTFNLYGYFSTTARKSLLPLWIAAWLRA